MNRESENKVGTTGSPGGEAQQEKEPDHPDKTVTGGADPVILDTRIQGRIRVHTRTRGHDLWEPLNITDVWEYISKSP